MHRKVRAVAQEPPGAPNDDAGDNETDGRIDPAPSRQKNGDPGHDDTERNGGIGRHMQKGAADV